MKIVLITDIEGVSGTVWGGYSLPSSGELKFYTKIMTAEINTVVRTLIEEGVDDIYLYEAHTFEEGVLPEIVRKGNDYKEIENADALFFIGQHGPASDSKAVLAHTMNSKCNYKLILNGMLCGELSYVAAIAGVYNVPVVFVSGDWQTYEEAKNNLPPLEFVCDEWGQSNHSAICRPFKSIEKELREKTKKALKIIPETEVFNIGEIELKVEHRYAGMSHKASQYSFIKQEGNFIVINAPDMVQADNLRKQVILARDFWCINK